MSYKRCFRGVAILLVCGIGTVTQARDRGQFAQSDAETKAWFEGLRSKIGPCCSDADGISLADVDWQSKNGHYEVRVPTGPDLADGTKAPSVWVMVPDDAVINEPNRIGRTMVWPIYNNRYFNMQGVGIRCFMPGSMT